MREPLTQLYVHLVWATWDRFPLLPASIRPRVYACIQAECDALKAEVIAIGGTADHVHLLVRISATLAVATLVKQAKELMTKLDDLESKLHNPKAKVAYDILAFQGGAKLYSQLGYLFEIVKDG